VAGVRGRKREKEGGEEERRRGESQEGRKMRLPLS
jgi:hypothetical protein